MLSEMVIMIAVGMLVNPELRGIVWLL
jgi:hypothetical protein